MIKILPLVALVAAIPSFAGSQWTVGHKYTASRDVFAYACSRYNSALEIEQAYKMDMGIDKIDSIVQKNNCLLLDYGETFRLTEIFPKDKMQVLPIVSMLVTNNRGRSYDAYGLVFGDPR